VITVHERGHPLDFEFHDLLRYHGGHSRGGLALAYKALERALGELGPVERRELVIETAFAGPGARDGFELVTRAVTDDRYVIDVSLAEPQLGRERERFVFCFTYRGETITLVLRDGFVTPEFIELARTEGRSAEQEARLDSLKLELAERVLAQPAAGVFDVRP
jgi:hypothetical protein